MANVPTNTRDPAAWWIAGALTLIVALLTWLVLMFRRSAVGGDRLLPPASAHALIADSATAPTVVDTAADQKLKERALAELTEFAKQSLVQGLYSQRNALLETQQKAQRELAELEARLVAHGLVLKTIARLLSESTIAELRAAAQGIDDEGMQEANPNLHMRRVAEEMFSILEMVG